ncbi:MAG TPA: hypothetical protein VGM62_13035 [Chthoniobacterales bacterium]|jgi:hypothetical protein
MIANKKAAQEITFNRRIARMGVMAALAVMSMLFATISQGALPTLMKQTELDKLAGQPVDIAPWAYLWRANLSVQEKPEAYFIPRRLERIDKVYRTAFTTLTPEELKSVYYDEPSLLKPLLPAPKGRLLTGLLWVGSLADYQVELHWPADVQAIPSPDAIEVRSYPTAWGWFGWTVDVVLEKPERSPDGRTWIYKPEAGAKMDWAYGQQVDAATEMVAVFSGGGARAKGVKPAVPIVRVTGPNLGNWKRMDVEIEWGFQAPGKAANFDGRLETYVAQAGPLSALKDDRGTKVAGANAWRSQITGDTRHGIVVPLVYAPGSRTGLDSRITIWTGATGVTIRLSDLDNGPILIPEQGLFVAKAGSGTSAKSFAAALAAKNLKSAREQVREHPEAASWDEALREVRLWRCPPGTAVPPFPPTPEPAMQVQLSDQRWVDMWRTATDQLRGKHLWGHLAAEVAPVAHAMEVIGLHDEADKIYDYFLASPGVKSDGDYAEPRGSLEWAKAMRHDMGYSHEATHCSTGRLLFSMMERMLLTGDREWFERNRVRLQAAADWIIRERNGYMRDVPNRKDLHVAGLMPPSMMGDYALPASDWHWYYFDNAFALQGLTRFADVMMEVDPRAGRKYRAEAEAFRADIRRAVERDAALAPVRRGLDGTCRSYIPWAAYTGGLMATELGAPQYGGGRPMDVMMGALPLASQASVLDASDARIVDTLDVMEESGTSAKDVRQLEEARKKLGLPTADAWFWIAYGELPKWSFNANIYLREDDVPNFLRFWMNESVSMVGSNGKLWEHLQSDQYVTCDGPDNGTAGWFLQNFRDLLVMEDGQSLWVARATPRSWLAQGQKIAVKSAPTFFGTLSYEIVSDVDHGSITTIIEIPNRKPIKSVILRLRHPQAAKIKSVMVNGKPWNGFNADKEFIELKGLKEKVVVVANYY